MRLACYRFVTRWIFARYPKRSSRTNILGDLQGSDLVTPAEEIENGWHRTNTRLRMGIQFDSEPLKILAIFCGTGASPCRCS